MNDSSDYFSKPLSEQKNYEVALGIAFKLAREKIASIANIADICVKSGATFIQSTQSIELKYLNTIYHISWPDIQISRQYSDEPVELRDKILILHYLENSKGTASTNNIISFKDFSEGTNYFPTFFKRSVQPLIQYFGQSPQIIFDLGKEMGGSKSNFGDVSVNFMAFPRVPITYVLWRGDSEFPPNANILFDSTVLDYLQVEDVVVLCQLITWKLIKSYVSNTNKI
jgi:hypothetical protein